LCGGNSSDIYLWWILWDEQIQNKKKPIRLASAGVGGLFLIFVQGINLALGLVRRFSAKFADFEYITNKV
jgi:hypothetical protein